jgi:cytochrome P450
MLDVLLDPDLEIPLTKQQIRDEIATFIVAGHETVASALTWAWHLLVTNPEELQNLRMIQLEPSWYSMSHCGCIHRLG